MDGRNAARRLVRQDLHVPAQRQQVAPGTGEAAHRQQGKADADETKGRRAKDAGQRQAEGEIAHQQLQERADTEIGPDQQARRDPKRKESPRKETSNAPWMVIAMTTISIRKMPR